MNRRSISERQLFSTVWVILLSTVLTIRESKIPMEPFVTKDGKTFALGFIKIHSDLEAGTVTCGYFVIVRVIMDLLIHRLETKVAESFLEKN